MEDHSPDSMKDSDSDLSGSDYYEDVSGERLFYAFFVLDIVFPRHDSSWLLWWWWRVCSMSWYLILEFLPIAIILFAGIDDEECDRLKAERIKEITDLEYQFSALKDQLYLEKINYLDRKLEEIRSGTAQEYLAPLDELVQNMEIRTQVAKIYRDKRLENVQCLHESEECAARQNLQVRMISRSTN